MEIAEPVYDGGLAPGWQDWGWGKHELGSGPARINLSNFGGWILHHDALEPRFGGIAFRMLAPASFGNFLQLWLQNGTYDKSFPVINVSSRHARKLPDGWVEIYVPSSELNPKSAPFDRVFFKAKTSLSSQWVEFDRVFFSRGGSNAAAVPVALGQPSVPLQVDCKGPGHPISPYIYGIAGNIKGTGATARRWGGNPTTRYNWELGNAYNVGKDWFFSNGQTADYRIFLSENRDAHVASALTVPTIGWVAKDTASYGFPVSVYGPQQAQDPNRKDAGNGLHPDGTVIAPGSPTITSVEAPPAMMQRWIEAIQAQDRETKTRSVQLYILDNEPSLWSSTHRDVHPVPLTYDELLDRTIRYASAIKAADPHALVAGPAEWGWTGYLYSAKDAAVGLNLRPDRRAHGDVPLIPWYLKQLREYEQKHRKRLLDVLDVHYYPQGDKVYSAAADPSTAALRLRSTRALWDPTYKDESWIAEPVRLLPRLKEWVKQNYPGLGISLGEYNFGGERDISGALAEAEALGRFGAEGIDYAFYWFEPPADSPVYWAFRAYRNFDGKNGQFLSRSAETKTSANVSLFASRDDSGKHWVLVALNLDPNTPAYAAIAMNGCAPVASRRKFVYRADTPALVDEGAKADHTLDEVLAPYSINVFDIELK